MVEQNVNVTLHFQKFHEGLGSSVGVYIRSLVHFSNAIDYVGTAGENLGRTFADRFSDHSKKYRNGESSYLKFDYKTLSQNTLLDYLGYWQKVVASGYKETDIYVPGMPSTYKKDTDESQRIATDIWQLYVAPLDNSISTLENRFGSRRAGLRAVEARLQTLLRTYYFYRSKNSHFPLRVNIEGNKGDSKTRGLILGDTRTADLKNSDFVRISDIRLPFESAEWNSFTDYVNANEATELSRSEANPLIFSEFAEQN